MGALLNRIYAKYASPGLMVAAHQRNIKFQFLVEAGCHDGADTVNFLKNPEIEKVYAFEPDDVAAKIAIARFAPYQNRVIFKKLALMDREGIATLFSPTGVLGDGSTIIQLLADSQVNDVDIEPRITVSTLDSEIKETAGDGALWLDAEGSAHKILNGSKKLLKTISICQVEVDMHSTSESRKANFVQVNRVLRKSNFRLVSAPLHPGYFGDAIYVKRGNLGKLDFARSQYLLFLMFALHLVIYKILKKPN